MKNSGKMTAIVIPIFIVLYLLPYSAGKKMVGFNFRSTLFSWFGILL